jgi:hypothetical protein
MMQASCIGKREFNSFVFLIFVFILCGGIFVFPDTEDARTVTAYRIVEEDRIHLDGQLTESVWRSAHPATGFLQQDPQEGEPATEKTEVFFLYDNDFLYIGAVFYDSNINGILAYKKQRDADLDTDDRFRWILDTFKDGRTGYFFEINPAGLMADGLLSTGIGFEPNKSWDGIWEARVSRHEDGWSAEIRIPFLTLNFNPEDESWGINFQRTIRRKNEEVLWSGHRRNQGLYQPVHAGRLNGLHGLSQGIGLEAKPYTRIAWRNMPGTEVPVQYPFDIGVDLQYSITPSLRAALTVNTDFAEAEVDQRRVNLTRFPLYFPEKRDFFLEGSGVYDFAVRNGANPYFSRRIGLDYNGETVPITYGMRLSGQMGRYELGFLQVRTGKHGGSFGEDFTVARVKRGLFEQSSLGLIYTRRAGGGLEEDVPFPESHTIGWDLDFKTANFFGQNNFQFEAFFVWHTDPVHGGFADFNKFSCRGIRVNFPNDIWRVHTSYREFGVAYDPAVGFRDRTGIRRLNPGLWYCPRPAGIPFIRQFEFGANHLSIWNIQKHHLESHWTNFTLLGIQFESGDELNINFQRKFERLDEPFTIHEEVSILTGDYRMNTWMLGGNTASHRIVTASIFLTRGTFWSGHRTSYEASLNVKPFSGVSVSAQFEKNDIDLLEGDFSTLLVRFLGEWHVNPSISMIGNFQYDDVSDIIGLFVRFRWIIRPGSDLYFVYTHNWLYDQFNLERSLWRTFSRSSAMKVNYTYRF